MRTTRLSLLLALFPALLAAQGAPTAPRTRIDTALKVEHPELRARATYPLDSAKALALRTVPGGKIASSELEQERGKLIYSFDVEVAGKPGIEEVNIDATNGKLVGREHEGEEDERAEGRERGRERAPRPARPRPATRPAAPAPAHP